MKRLWLAAIIPLILAACSSRGAPMTPEVAPTQEAATATQAASTPTPTLEATAIPEAVADDELAAPFREAMALDPAIWATACATLKENGTEDVAIEGIERDEALRLLDALRGACE